MLKTFHTSYIGKKKSRAVTALGLLSLMLCLTGCSMEGVPFANWDLYHSETYKMQNLTKPEIFQVMQMKYKR